MYHRQLQCWVCTLIRRRSQGRRVGKPLYVLVIDRNSTIHCYRQETEQQTANTGYMYKLLKQPRVRMEPKAEQASRPHDIYPSLTTSSFVYTWDAKRRGGAVTTMASKQQAGLSFCMKLPRSLTSCKICCRIHVSQHAIHSNANL